MTRLSSRDLLLLTALTLAWGLNWPVMKYGVAELPPLYFRALCIGGGLAALWAWARATGVPLAVAPGRWGAIVRLAVPNAIVWHLLVIVALKMLPAGRSAILGYTMPVWVVVTGLLFFGERPTPRQALGVTAALVGTLLLLSSELRAIAGAPAGTLLMLTAAAAWGYGTHLMRRELREMPTLVLTFWMLAMTFAVMLAASLVFEWQAWRWPLAGEWGSIVYNMLAAIAFCHVAWSHLARTLPPVASAISVMMIPVLGVFSAVWFLGERPLWQDYLALVLIVLAMASVLLPGRPRAAP
ncbi:MAG: DMT family transporter [Sutterellaceae bacterium]|nr:DMT family transporter [Burkholderiaceae bacterium]MDW8430048.1 DMT family transporter [Sutterellaceae bacterium]